MIERTRGSRALAWTALVLLAGCSKPDKESQTSSARSARSAQPANAVPEPGPWTPAFPQKAVLIAERIEIVGPRSLIEHLAMGFDEGFRRVVGGHDDDDSAAAIHEVVRRFVVRGWWTTAQRTTKHESRTTQAGPPSTLSFCPPA